MSEPFHTITFTEEPKTNYFPSVNEVMEPDIKGEPLISSMQEVENCTIDLKDYQQKKEKIMK